MGNTARIKPMKKWNSIGLAALLGASVLTGCGTAMIAGAGGGAQGRQVDEQRRGDQGVTAKVVRTLVRDPSVDAMDIDVHTFDGVVTLTGRVPSYAAARRAEALAAQVPGVERVEVRLSIKR
jgi:hyperosmotically inducible protein